MMSVIPYQDVAKVATTVKVMNPILLAGNNSRRKERALSIVVIG